MLMLKKICNWLVRRLSVYSDYELVAGGQLKWAVRMFHFFTSQKIWSFETFGPPSFKGPKGPLDHLRKEVEEAYHETDVEDQKMELVDCLFLVFDACHRCHMPYDELVSKCQAKLMINRSRYWPDWRETDPDKAIEHDRTREDKS